MSTETIPCEEAIRLIATYLDRELDAVETSQVREHIERCRSCYSRADFEQQLKAQLSALKVVPAPRELSERIRGLLHAYES